MPTSTDARSAPTDTASRLAQAAGQLLDEAGASAVTMRAVGRRAGVSAMASYHWFPDRDALLARLADDAFADLAARFELRAGTEDVDTALHGILDDVLDLAFARPHLYALAFTERRAGARDLATQATQSPTLRVLTGVLERARTTAGWLVDDPVEIAITFAGLVQGLWLAWHAGRIALGEPEFRGLVHRCCERVLVGLRA